MDKLFLRAQVFTRGNESNNDQSTSISHYDNDGNFYANIEEVPSTTAWRPEPSFTIPLMVPPTLDQHRILQALQRLLDPIEPTFEHGNVHAICGQRRART